MDERLEDTDWKVRCAALWDLMHASRSRSERSEYRFTTLPLLLDESLHVRLAADFLWQAEGWFAGLPPRRIRGDMLFWAMTNSVEGRVIADCLALHMDIVLLLLTDEDESTRQRAKEAFGEKTGHERRTLFRALAGRGVSGAGELLLQLAAWRLFSG